MDRSICLLVEGGLDEAVGRRICSMKGLSVVTVFGKRGAGYIRAKIDGFNGLAQGTRILALADLMDMHGKCPPEVRRELLPYPSAGMCFRLAEQEVESWLLGDRIGLSRRLRTSVAKFPARPDELANPKQALVSLARESRSPRIRALMVPAPGTTASEGPGYTAELQDYVSNDWDVAAAAANSPSLARCLRAIEERFNDSVEKQSGGVA